ncbi:GH1 family beta-glucosidase [Aquipuribacter nitratireducens]|uniref:Beta-glucosidase n=1 Tax=Aquipuribacter nitratireducens TaxID=650104 RepID=A0ABW0GLZ7_9MICO
MADLPQTFVWGAATASFQIEGDRAGRGDTVWDAFAQVPGAVADGTDGDVTCDHIHRYREDVALLRDLGVDAYRFSVAWARVQPTGRGDFSADGLGFYDRLVDELLGAGVEPWVTLYHWDLPLELQLAGGWASRRTVDHFVEYALTVQEALGDRVKRWATHNEPWCAAWLGHGNGVHAPGVRDHALAARVTHHLLLSHGRAVAAMRQQDPDAAYGIVLNLDNVRAADDAAVTRDALPAYDALRNRVWLDPLAGRGYPADALELLHPHLDGAVEPGDLDQVATPTDWLGLNYYNDAVFEAGEGAVPTVELLQPGLELVRQADPGADATAMGWPITPDGFTDVLVRLQEEYAGLGPFVVTENGSAWDDDPTPGPDGVVEDPRRVAYLHAHLEALDEARRRGVDVRGYFAWSLLDNFEWALGLSKRFGLVRVDFDTLERTPKRSYLAYRDAVAARRG